MRYECSSMTPQRLDASHHHLPSSPPSVTPPRSQAALLIRAGAVCEDVHATVRQCIGHSASEPPLMGAVRLLLQHADVKLPSTGGHCELDRSLLLLASKSVLRASERARRTFSLSGGRGTGASRGVEEAEAQSSPMCEWVRAAALTEEEEEGPERYGPGQSRYHITIITTVAITIIIVTITINITINININIASPYSCYYLYYDTTT